MSFKVIVSGRVDRQLLQHVEFLSKVSVPAAKRFRAGYAQILERLEDNPFQFPAETDPNLPSGIYRQAFFEKRYKALFIIDGDSVFLDAVVDCRQNACD